MRKRGSGEKEIQAVQKLPKSLAVDGDAGDALHGTWTSEKGKCTIGKDPVTARLSYTEPVGDDERVHGWLDLSDKTSVWEGSLVLLKANEGPWYGPSFGPPPEVVGDIQVKLLTGEEAPCLETRIRMADEDQEWSEPTKFRLQDSAELTMPKPDLSNVLPMGKRDEEGQD
mmetsp:Transcript_32314/g.60840  ORF Transcript_32314/g.60840 Transcript_32314/m.60840 type:complete len:170 (+) Transcript_32314:43-552(+)